MLKPSTRLLALTAGIVAVQVARPPLPGLEAAALLLEMLWLFTALRGGESGRRGWLRRWLLALWVLAPFMLASLTLIFSGTGRLPVLLWLRAWICIQWAAWTAHGMADEDFVAGLTRLRLPASMVETIALTLRYLSLLKDESQRMARAREARSGRQKASWFWMIKTHGSSLGNLLLRALSRSERVYLAMQARGYRGPVAGRCCPLEWTDWAVVGACLVILGASLSARALGWGSA